MSNYAPTLPLTSDPSNGYENLQTIERVALQNLKMLCLTAPGERCMDPNFGVGIRNYLFEQNVPSTHSKIKTRIIRQVGEYMPFLEIVEVKFDSTSPKNAIINTFHEVWLFPLLGFIFCLFWLYVLLGPKRK